METDEADGATPWARPKVFTLRLPATLRLEFEVCAFETGLSMNEIVAYGVQKLMHEARADLNALVQGVAAQRAERRAEVRSLHDDIIAGAANFLRSARDQKKTRVMAPGCQRFPSGHEQRGGKKRHENLGEQPPTTGERSP